MYSCALFIRIYSAIYCLRSEFIAAGLSLCDVRVSPLYPWWPSCTSMDALACVLWISMLEFALDTNPTRVHAHYKQFKYMMENYLFNVEHNKQHSHSVCCVGSFYCKPATMANRHPSPISHFYGTVKQIKRVCVPTPPQHHPVSQHSAALIQCTQRQRPHTNNRSAQLNISTPIACFVQH